MDASLTFSPIRNAGGEITGVAAIGRDVTAQTGAREALRRSEARLAEAQQLAHVGSYALDLATQEVTWSQEMYRLFEYDPAGGVPTYAAVRARYHPDDLARRDEAYAATLAGGGPYKLDMRLVLPGDRTRWCQVQGRVERDAAGRAVRLAGTVMDVTERQQAEEALRRSRERLEQAQAVAHVGHWEQDCRAGTYYWSPETFRLYGLPPRARPRPRWTISWPSCTRKTERRSWRIGRRRALRGRPKTGSTASSGPAARCGTFARSWNQSGTRTGRWPRSRGPS